MGVRGTSTPALKTIACKISRLTIDTNAVLTLAAGAALIHSVNREGEPQNPAAWPSLRDSEAP
jgi:hypothetical protein